MVYRNTDGVNISYYVSTDSPGVKRKGMYTAAFEQLANHLPPEKKPQHLPSHWSTGVGLLQLAITEGLAERIREIPGCVKAIEHITRTKPDSTLKQEYTLALQQARPSDTAKALAISIARMRGVKVAQILEPKRT